MSEELHTLVGLYVVDALDDDERARFEAHLAGCPACQQEVAEFRSTTGRLSQLMAERPPESLRAAIMARVASTPQESPAPPPDELAARRRVPDAVRGAGPRRGRRGDRAAARHRVDQLAPGPRPPGGDLRRAHRP